MLPLDVSWVRAGQPLPQRTWQQKTTICVMLTVTGSLSPLVIYRFF